MKDLQQHRAEQIGVIVKQLAPVGSDWMVIVWDGAGEVGTCSSVPHERLAQVLQQIRGTEQVAARIADAELAARTSEGELAAGRGLESPLADLPAALPQERAFEWFGEPDRPTPSEHANAAVMVSRRREHEHDHGPSLQTLPDLDELLAESNQSAELCEGCGGASHTEHGTGGNANPVRWQVCSDGCGWASPPEPCD